MANPAQLRTAAREIYGAALRAVDAGEAVRRAVRLNGGSLHICDYVAELGNRRIYSIGLGKAAAPMAFALEETLGTGLTAGFFSGPFVFPARSQFSHPQELKLRTRWRWNQGGHPLPNKASLSAANYAFELLQQANDEKAIVFFLISGGGSAMIEWPANQDITLADLRTANQVLVNCGASIAEINSVRRAFSAVKGGQLAMRAPNCEQVTLIISDVPQGEERIVASGPTVAPPPDAPDPRDVLNRYKIRDRLSSAIVRAIESADTSQIVHDDIGSHFALLNNESALRAAKHDAEMRGFATELAQDIGDESIEHGSELLIQQLRDLRNQQRGNQKPVCLISGGEFSCPVRGDGVGGRNLETALRLALIMARLGSPTEFVALCAGTDGVDGNSPAAGAIMDSTTIERARSIGLDAQDFLRRSDSYSFFHALRDDVSTGPTGTNVRDIRILIALK